MTDSGARDEEPATTPADEPTVADRLAEAGENPEPGAPATDEPATSAGETLSRGPDVIEP